jgi:hypothetical protein
MMESGRTAEQVCLNDERQEKGGDA